MGKKELGDTHNITFRELKKILNSLLVAKPLLLLESLEAIGLKIAAKHSPLWPWFQWKNCIHVKLKRSLSEGDSAWLPSSLNLYTPYRASISTREIFFRLLLVEFHLNQCPLSTFSHNQMHQALLSPLWIKYYIISLLSLRLQELASLEGRKDATKDASFLLLILRKPRAIPKPWDDSIPNLLSERAVKEVINGFFIRLLRWANIWMLSGR